MVQIQGSGALAAGSYYCLGCVKVSVGYGPVLGVVALGFLVEAGVVAFVLACVSIRVCDYANGTCPCRNFLQG